MTTEERGKLDAALSQFKDAVAHLDYVWSTIPQSGDAMEGTYPEYLPSFDEFAHDVFEMRLQPEQSPKKLESPSLRPVEICRVGMRVIPRSLKVASWIRNVLRGDEHFDWLNTSDSGLITAVSTGSAGTIEVRLDDGRRLRTTYGDLNEVVSS